MGRVVVHSGREGRRGSALGASPSRLGTPANVSSLNLLRTLPGR